MGAFENLKDAVKLVQAVGNAEVYQKMIGVQTDFLELLERNHQLQDENRELREQLSQKERADELLSQRSHRNNAYWVGDDPYCTACWDDRDKRVRLTVYKTGYAECPVCKVGVRVDPAAAEMHSRRLHGAVAQIAKRHRQSRYGEGVW